MPWYSLPKLLGDIYVEQIVVFNSSASSMCSQRTFRAPCGSRGDSVPLVCRPEQFCLGALVIAGSHDLITLYGVCARAKNNHKN